MCFCFCFFSSTNLTAFWIFFWSVIFITWYPKIVFTIPTLPFLFWKAVKLATIAKKIEASEETENTIFEQAEQLAYDITNGGSIDDLAKEKNFIVRPLVGLKAMEDAVAGLGTNRGIVRWTFDEETSVNSVRRFVC